MLSATADGQFEPGDYRRCLRCFVLIEPGQRRKPYHRRGKRYAGEPWGWRHTVCKGADLRAAREAADRRNTAQQKRHRDRVQPYPACGPVTVTHADGSVTVQPAYKRKDVAERVTRHRPRKIGSDPM